jgi:O-antigen ligase
MGPAAEQTLRAPGTGALVLVGLVGAALLGATFAGGGSGIGGVLPVGGAAVVLLAATFVAVGIGKLPAPSVGRSGALVLLAMGALVAWTGATVAWSIMADRSWDAFDKTLVYGAFLGLGMMVSAAAGRCSARLGASLLSVVVGATLVWALVAKAVPALDPEGDRVARLREPVGYWNALALLADVAIVLGLWLGTRSGHRRGVRIAGGLLVYVATLALMLTLSRAGVVVGVGVLALWLALVHERVESGVLLAVSAGPAALVGAWAFTRPALTEDVASRADRIADGRIFAVLTLVGAAVVAVLVGVVAARVFGEAVRRRAGRVLVAVAAVAVAAAVVAVGVAAADAVSSGRSCGEVVNDPSRFGSLDPNNRMCWWAEALDVFAGHAPVGAGAGTFEVARKRYRDDARNVLQPHSVPLQHLSDGGVPGIALFLAFVAAVAAACTCALRRLDGPEKAAAVALVAAPTAYAGHALVDYGWDFLPVTAPTMVAVGVLVAAGRTVQPARPRPFLAVGAVVLAAAALASFSFPRLADRMERSSTLALVDGDFELARDRAQWARFFNPLSVDPLHSLARIAERQRFFATAERKYIQAVELQPDNPAAWYALGIYEFEVRRNLCAAYRFLNDAYTLDPAGNQWVKGGPLDVARDAVNAGGCAAGS